MCNMYVGMMSAGRDLGFIKILSAGRFIEFFMLDLVV